MGNIFCKCKTSQQQLQQHCNEEEPHDNTYFKFPDPISIHAFLKYNGTASSIHSSSSPSPSSYDSNASIHALYQKY